MNSSPIEPAYAVVGRYAIFDEIAAGGMATVHLGKLLGSGGFSRVVAIKRLHPQFAKDEEFASMFMDEARLAARIQHPNVVQTLDVVTVDKELLLVMEYVHGVSFASLLHLSRKHKRPVDPRIAAAVVAGALEGLHSAHEAKSEVGVPLGVVHRDISPQNVLVGIEGVPRILDFGVAKAVGKMHATREGQLKGKLAYMSPEQVRSQEVTRQSDIFSTAIVLWEALMGQRLFDGNNPAELIMQVLSDPIPSPRSRFPDLPEALDAVVMKGLARDPALRYATARDMAVDLEAAIDLASPRETARWVEALSGETLNARTQLLERIERAAAAGVPDSGPAAGIKSGPVEPFAATYDGSGPRAFVGKSGTRPRSIAPPPPGAPAASTGAPSSAPPVSSGPYSPAPSPRGPSGPSYPLAATLDATDPAMWPPLSAFPQATRTPAPVPESGPVTPAAAVYDMHAAPITSPSAGNHRGPPPASAPARTPPGGGGSGARPFVSDPPPARTSVNAASAASAGSAPRPAWGGSDPGDASRSSSSVGGAGGAGADGYPDPLSPLQPSRPRRVPIPIEPVEQEHISLRERVETPLKVVVLGVVLSVVDALTRPYLPELPVRPIWIAEILVVAGVLWALARLVLPVRSSRD